jgi:hypothetical protein
MDVNTLSEILLLSLYDLAEEQPHSYFFFQLDEIGARIGATDMEQMIKAAHILESRGFVTLSMGPWPALSAMISGDGIDFVENGGESGIIKAYRNNPQEITALVESEVQAVIESRPGLPLEPTPEKVPEPSINETIDEILFRICSIVENDSTITPSVREDALRDIESLKIQLSRSSRNWRLVETLLDSLAEIPSLLNGLKALASVLRNLE